MRLPFSSRSRTTTAATWAIPVPAVHSVNIVPASLTISRLLVGHAGGGSEEVLDADRQVADPLAGSVMDRIDYRLGRPNAGQLTDAFRADLAEGQIGRIEQFDLQKPHISIHRNRILGNVIVQESAETRIDLARFAQGCADAPDEPAQHLALRRASAQHATAIGDGHHPRDARPRHKWINLHFREMRDIGEADIVRKFRAQKRDLAQRRLSEGVRRQAGRGTVRHTIDMVNLGPGQDVGYTLTLATRQL